MNAITPVQAGAPVIGTPEPPSLSAFIAQAVRDPKIDVGKLKALLDMKRELQAEDAKLQFNIAMRAVQSEMQPVMRDAENTQTRSRYARLETIDAALRPIYTKHGFSISFNAHPGDGTGIRISCEVMHVAGHAKTFGPLEAPPDLSGPKGNANKTALHGLGSSVSYLIRYLTRMVFHVVLTDEDDDGNGGSRADNGSLRAEQTAHLRALMRETCTQEAVFLRVMCPDATFSAIDQVPASEFSRLRNALITKRTILARRAAASQSQAQGSAP